jgi:hypothetical protein
MTQKIEVLEYTLPDYLAGYLINGDRYLLKDEEIKEIDDFLTKEGVRIVSIQDDSSFCHRNDLHSSGGNCSTYIAHKIK